jgi:hypothetical protein
VITPSEAQAIRNALSPEDQIMFDDLVRAQIIAEMTPHPQPGPQTLFLESEADIVIYGGAAGGGKTYGLFLEAIKDCDKPAFRWVYFRRQQTDINKNGGPWDKAMQFFPLFKAWPNKTSYKWQFPSGAYGQLASLQYDQDVLGWQTAEVSLFLFDELTHFTEAQFWYMLSRNRGMSGAKNRVRAATNPDGSSWVKKLIAPWVDKKWTGYKAESGEVLYLARLEGENIWVDKDWRYPTGDKPKSITFIRSTVYDNKILLKDDPGYITNLLSQTSIEKARLLDGDWDILEGAYFAQWSEKLHTRYPGQDEFSPDPIPKWYKFFGGLDYGRAAPFCFLLMATDDGGNVVVFDEIYEAKLEPEAQSQAVLECLERHQIEPRDVPIYADPSIFPSRAPAMPSVTLIAGLAPTKAKPLPGWSMTTNAGKHISDVYSAAGLRMIPSSNANTRNERVNGWAMVREYLTRPGALIIYKGRCPNLIRTVAAIPHDKTDIEDLDTKAEDHAVDALRFGLKNKGIRSKPESDYKPPLPAAAPAWMKQAFNKKSMMKL